MSDKGRGVRMRRDDEGGGWRGREGKGAGGRKRIEGGVREK